MSKLKIFFGRNETVSKKEKENYTQGHLGNDGSNFFYDAKLGKYVFNDEPEQEVEKILEPPPKDNELKLNETSSQNEEKLSGSEILLKPGSKI